MRAHHRAQCLTAVAALLWLSACGGEDSTSENSETPVRDATVRPLDDLGSEGGAGGGEGGSGGGDGGTGGDVTDGGSGGEMGGEGGGGAAVRQVRDCDQACQVFDDCGQIDVWNGMIENCLEACAPVADDPRIANFFNCLAVASCENVGACRPPDPPPPTCSDICAAMESCEGDFRLPAGLPNVGECSAACTDATLAPLVTRCAQPVLEGVCDPGDVDRCILSGLYGECLEACTRLGDCDAPEASDVIDCTLACDEVSRGDPLVSHRQSVRNACIAQAGGNCDVIAACGTAAGPEIVGEHTLEDLCAANADCPLFAAETCVEDAGDVLEGVADNSIDCLVDHLTEHCDDGDLFRCFRPTPGVRADCDEHCLVGNLCEVLPDGQTEGVCADLCTQVSMSGTGAERADLEAELQCDEGLTCMDVQACRSDGGPIERCRIACGRLIECGAHDSAQGCEDECVGAFATNRARAQRTCVGAATTCEQVALCVPPPPPPCDALCEYLVPCDLGADDCETVCDNADLVDASAFLPRLACDAATDRCSEREICEGGDLSGGIPCMAYCRTVGACAGGDEAGMIDCVQRCGAGLGGAEGLVFEGALECLEATGAGGACARLQACLNSVEPDDFCAGYCAGLDGCRLGEGTVEDCVTACEGRTDEADFLADAACTLSSIRRGAGCAAVAVCNDIVVEPASPACATLCAAQHACNDSLDVFLCERDCVADAAGDDLRAVCAQGAACGDQLQTCLDAPNDPPQACVDICTTVEGCMGFADGARFADSAACLADCGGNALLENADYTVNLGMCITAVAEADCALPAIESCYLNANVDPLCTEVFNAFVACGIGDFIGDVDAYNMTCEMNLEADEAATIASAECIIDVAAMAMGDLFTCFGGIAACPPPPSGGFMLPAP